MSRLLVFLRPPGETPDWPMLLAAVSDPQLHIAGTCHAHFNQALVDLQATTFSTLLDQVAGAFNRAGHVMAPNPQAVSAQLLYGVCAFGALYPITTLEAMAMDGPLYTDVEIEGGWLGAGHIFDIRKLNTIIRDTLNQENTRMGITEIINTFDRVRLELGIDVATLLPVFKQHLPADAYTVLETGMNLRANHPTVAGAPTSTPLYEAVIDTLKPTVTNAQPQPAPAYNHMLAGIVDPALKQMGLPDSATIANTITALSSMNGTTLDQVPSLLSAASHVAIRVKELERKLATAPSAAPAAVQASGALPAGRVVMQKGSDLFPKMKSLGFEVPTWEWDTPHPWVPAINPSYQFREDLLRTVLYAISQDKRLWLHGHTGTGKTTLVEQVAARLGYPVRRVNFTGDTEAYSLIGQKILTPDPTTGQTITTWQDGVLPQAMQTPCILLLDEVSFAKPGTIGALQAVTEPRGVLFLQEDGNRAVHPDPMLRIFATDNTAGQGDESGLYAGTRPTNAAAFSRFTLRLKVPYIERADEAKLLMDLVPSLQATDADRIAHFAFEARESLAKGEIYLPVSPRCTIEMAEMFAFLTASGLDPKRAMKECLNRTVLDDVASATDASVLRGLAQRANCN